MNRRSAYKNYTLPGIYHITVRTVETLRHPLGKVVGDMDKPDGDPEAPHVELSPVGQMVEHELLHSIAAHYPMVTVDAYVIMPEHLHFILVVSKPIVSSSGRHTHLGQVIAGFKKGCNCAYWDITGQTGTAGEPPSTGTGEPPSTGAGKAPSTGAGNMLSVPCGSPAGKRTPSNGSTGRPVLFAPGYCDVMPVDAAQLEQQRAYIKGNPRSRLMRSSNRERLQPQRGGIDTALTLSALRGYLQRECAVSQLTGLSALESRLRTIDGYVTCDSYGNRELLDRQCLPVVCHRKDARRMEEQKGRCLEAAAQGVVLVSARIAKGEREIIDEAIARGFASIIVADNGFPEVYHPSEERIKQCAASQLLIVSPWVYRYRPKDESITVAECKTMNCIAQALCRTRDSWWIDRQAEPAGSGEGNH